MKKIKHRRLLIVLLLPFLTCISSAGIVHIGAILSASDSISGTVNPMYSQLITASLMAIHDLNSLYNNARKISFKLGVRDSMSTYEGAIAATIDVTTRTFGVNEIHAIIGGGNNKVTDGMSSLLKYSDIYQIYSLSNISSLEPRDYPNVLRVYPSSADECSALAEVLWNYFSYSRIVLIHSSDIYGLAGANKFVESLSHLEINTLQDCAIDDEAEIDDCLKLLKYVDARVFVFILSRIDIAGLLLTNGVTAGIFNDDCIFFGTGSLSTPLLWTQVSLDPAVVRKVASSFFTISLADADWKVTSRGKSFINKFRSQTNSVATLSDGTRVCSNQTDDDGQFNLFQIVPKGKTQYLCAGEKYSAFAADGSDIVSYTSFIYDAVWSAGVAAVLFADTYNNGEISTNAKAISGKKSVFQNLNFVGYSGNISFAKANDHLGGFRSAGLRYQISHFTVESGSGSGNRTLSNITLHRVGTSTMNGVFTACTSDPTMQSAVTGGCSELRYGNINNIRPSDRAPNIIQALSSTMRSTLYVMAAVNFTVIVFFTVILIVYRRSRILRAAQPAMMWIILSSNIYHVVRIVMSSGISNSFVCVCNVWTSHLAFMGIVAMFLKTLRIFIIVKSGIRKIRIGPGHVLSLMCIMYFFWFIYLAVYTFIDPPRMYVAFAENRVTGQLTEIRSCTKGKHRLDIFLIILEAGIITATAVLCFLTREVPDAINESKAIALSLALIISLLLISLLSTVLPDQAQVEFLFGFCFFFSSIGSMIIYFGVRSCMLLSGADLNGKFEIVWDKNATSDKTNHHMSTRVSKNSANSRMSRNEIQVPTTADECYQQISQLKKVLVTILAHEAHNLNNTFPSIRVKRASVDGARKSVETIALGEIHTQGREVNASQRQEEERQHQYRNQHQHQHHTEKSKILPIASDE